MIVEHNFFLPLDPIATPRSRFTCRGRFAQAYTDPKYKEWLEKAVPMLVDIARTEDFRSVSERPVRITVEVILTRPKTSKLDFPRGDNDNYEKGLWDAITKTGKWWKDDNQIVQNTTLKRWARAGETPGYDVCVEFL